MIDDDDEERPALPSDFRLKPSRNQKRRSKLSQLPEPPPTPSETLPAAAPTSPPADNPPAQLKKVRLKRSGQMHEDLTAPMSEDSPKRKETDY